MGFVGRSAIHLPQVPIVNEVFTPTEEEVAEARAARPAEGRPVEEGAFVLEDGRFVDRAVVESARLTLAWREGGEAVERRSAEGYRGRCRGL